MKIKSKLNVSFEKYFSIIAIILIAIYSFSITPKTLQNDTYYTIKIGEHITENGIDMKDPFSWHEDLDYTYPHWLYDYITYQVYDKFDMEGVYTATCMLSIILGLSIYLINIKINKNKIISFILTIGIMYTISSYIAARAQLATFILFMLQIFFIEQYLKNKKKRYGVGLIILPLLIANLHLAVFPFYFVIFLPYIAEYLLLSYTNMFVFRVNEKRILEFKIKNLNRQLKNAKVSETQKNEIKEKIKKINIQLDKLKENVIKRKVKREEELKKAYKIEAKLNKNVKGLIVIMIIAAFTGFLTPLRNNAIYVFSIYNARQYNTKHK